MPFPVLGALAGTLVRRGGVAAARLGGRALRALTKGKLIGQGGGAIAARRIAGGVVTAATAAEVARSVRSARTGSMPTIDATATMSEPRTYRRMNPMNAKALNRAIRRLSGAEKLFKKVFAFNHGRQPSAIRPKLKRGR